MTNIFSEADVDRCNHYAKFFRKFSELEINLVFWSLFLLVLILMSMCSIIHHKSIALNEANKTLSEDIAKSQEHLLRVRRTRVKYLSLVSLCAVIGIFSCVLECFAILNIQYCVGEDLMQLYWSLWSILQVGSNIAILGVILQFWIILGDVETPSWAVALGTPVLVFAALAFLLKELWKKGLARIFNKHDKQDEDTKVVQTPNDLEKGIDPEISQT
ncbi:hypothetical protein OnM2_075011 [Erysiphe neolycopersici]|uniref:Uncharacterized protein n=1 Tax=Erysiphe neolycopersici TaxID=212602 RepID=A0A420HIP1_9PEZI|nr:hypothetical protein OnM2_075011 [Erysiphe neolycopersici]